MYQIAPRPRLSWLCISAIYCETRSRATTEGCGARLRQNWLRGLDSNQDSKIQSLMCYQLHHPGAGNCQCTLDPLNSTMRGALETLEEEVLQALYRNVDRLLLPANLGPPLLCCHRNFHARLRRHGPASAPRRAIRAIQRSNRRVDRTQFPFQHNPLAPQ